MVEVLIYSPMGPLNVKNFSFNKIQHSLQSVFMDFMWISEETTVISL